MSASTALERGIGFLLAKQHGDGLWRDFATPAGEASEWPTGFVGAALAAAGADDAALGRAADALVARQHDDGGWGYNRRVPTDADSTAWALLFLARTGNGWSGRDRAADCLVRHQRRRSGGVATYREAEPIRRFMGVGRWVRFGGWCRPHTEVTATAGRALAALGPGGHTASVAAAWRYVRSQQRRDGSWSSYWWTSPHYATLEAVELALALGQREAATRAAGWAIRTQGDDGAWSARGTATSAFATALSLSVLLRAGAGRRPVERAISRLCALQDDDGGWPAHDIMRIPLPGDAHPDRRRPRPFGRGVVVRDQHRTFTSAACVAALAHACGGGATPD
jgi:squalene cyclase